MLIETQSTDRAETISAHMLTWYSQHGRHLPWRQTNDPYRIWISEIMLQQTQVNTVIPYYERFIYTLPDIRSLAQADTEQVYKLWEGLGYYSRAANLQTAAQQIMENCHGIFPKEFEAILSLKGIGMYTACAVSSIAFGQPRGVVDGNTLRIISRLYNYEENIALDKTRKKYQVIMDQLAAVNAPGAFNQSMMDLGATICTPRSPSCDKCPIRHCCMAYEKNTQHLLPVNIKKRSQETCNYVTVVVRSGTEYMLIKNTEGLLKNLYGCIQFECQTPTEYEQLFYDRYHMHIRLDSYIRSVRHVFTHRIWEMQVYEGEISEFPEIFRSMLFSEEDIEKIPVSTAHLKVLKAYKKYTMTKAAAGM